LTWKICPKYKIVSTFILEVWVTIQKINLDLFARLVSGFLKAGVFIILEWNSGNIFSWFTENFNVSTKTCEFIISPTFCAASPENW
jgi:hypothetical protein